MLYTRKPRVTKFTVGHYVEKDQISPQCKQFSHNFLFINILQLKCPVNKIKLHFFVLYYILYICSPIMGQ